ncbi:FG-GAP repeat protein, partial [Dapis sp. BLCC M172]|uniref:FG-GAP repeat protein n=1 Tax=Dapis sp. BLCC M172 TaxID=2975281 RepID=UPI003CF9AA42
FETTTGSLLQKITAPDGSQEDNFGFSVALSDHLALIGAFRDDENGEDIGSAYLFETTTGSLLQKITAPDGSPFDSFGFSVALRDNLALIGAPADDENGSNSGSAYLFTINPQPTPEPSSLLGIAGTVAIAALSRKKQQKK